MTYGKFKLFAVAPSRIVCVREKVILNAYLSENKGKHNWDWCPRFPCTSGCWKFSPKRLFQHDNCIFNFQTKTTTTVTVPQCGHQQQHHGRRFRRGGVIGGPLQAGQERKCRLSKAVDSWFRYRQINASQLHSGRYHWATKIQKELRENPFCLSISPPYNPAKKE